VTAPGQPPATGKFIAVSMGDPSGIGPEIIGKAFDQRATAGIPPFLVIGDPAMFDRPTTLGASENDDPGVLAGEAMAAWNAGALPVLPVKLAVDTVPGKPDPRNADAIISAIEIAFSLADSGIADALVTAPIHKQSLYQAGFPFPGHTEFLADLAGRASGVPPVPRMLLTCPALRVALATIHLPLRRVADALTTDGLLATLQQLHRGLRQDFAIEAPRIAVTGLNPHAGEGGTLGDEESTVIAPAIAAARAAGIEATGPFAADSVFAADRRRHYDCVLCMYHDQGLVALKTLDFAGGVNVTLGLPVVRTSVDHGTAHDIAGQRIANPQSLVAALALAAEMAANRQRSWPRKTA